MLFFFVIILEVFTWALEGKTVSIVLQTTENFPNNSSVITLYVVAISLTLGGVSAIFWALSTVSWRTWMKIAKVLAIEHLFEEQDRKMREEGKA